MGRGQEDLVVRRAGRAVWAEQAALPIRPAPSLRRAPRPRRWLPCVQPERLVSWQIDPDGRGYTLEARVPWGFFEGPPPAAARRIPCDMRVMCGDEEGSDYAYNMIWSARNMAFNRTEQWGQAVLEQFAVSSEIEIAK